MDKVKEIQSDIDQLLWAITGLTFDIEKVTQEIRLKVKRVAKLLNELERSTVH